MDFWKELMSIQWLNASWIVIYVICLALLFKNRNRWDVRIKRIIIFIIMTLLLYYCPFVAEITCSHFLPGAMEYVRIAWLIFTIPIIAYTFVMVLSDLKRKQCVKAIVLFVVLCLLLGGLPFVSQGFVKADNKYKLPDSTIAIGDAITEDANCYSDDTLLGMRQVRVDDTGKAVKPKVLVQVEKLDHLGTRNIYYGIRQYTSAPVLTPVTIPSSTYNSSSFKLSKYTSLMNYEYFVCAKNEYLRKQVESYGFVLLTEVEDYVVYKNNKEVTIYFVRHGQTDANVNDVFAGSGTDAKLTAKGISDAKTTGEALSDIQFDSAYVSELTRTNDTASYILDRNKKKKPKLTKTANLNDIYAGQLEGLTRDEVVTRYPDYSEDKYFGTITDSKFVSPVGASSKYTMANKYKTALLSAISNTPNNGNALIVGHGGFSWMLKTLFPDEMSDSEWPNNASITVIKYNKGKFELEHYNMDASQFEEIE